uniref:Uncharacterized protein n=1 Tax=Anguilla anguilla TaxID=7936 RepID=A0A0E9W991_ANGAN
MHTFSIKNFSYMPINESFQDESYFSLNHLPEHVR